MRVGAKEGVLLAALGGCAPPPGLLGDPGLSAEPYALCTRPETGYAGWTEVREGPVSFRVPPGFRRVERTGHESAIWEQTWQMGQRAIYVYTTRDAEEYRNLNPRCTAEVAEGRFASLGLIRYDALDTFGFSRERYVGGRWAAAGNWDLPGPYGFRVYVAGRNDQDTGELARHVMWSVQIDESAADARTR